MPFDGIVTHAVKNELNNALSGFKIRKIYQPEKDEIRLLLNGNGKNVTLLISANSSNARVHLTETKKENPEVPPSFCMLLRKHLTNATIEGVEQLGSDRVLVLNITTSDEVGDTLRLKLLCEITGKNSNIILTKNEAEKDIILDSIKRVNALKNSYRQILPGYDYVAPPVESRQSFLDYDTEKLREVLTNSNTSVEHTLIHAFLGLSPRVAREIAFRAHIDETLRGNELHPGEINRLLNACEYLFENLTPVYRIYGEKNPVDFSTVELTSLGDEYTEYESSSAMLESFYAQRDKRMHFKTKSSNLKHQLDTLRKKNSKKLNNLHRDLKRAQKNAENKRYADLITANIYQLKRGMKEAELLDYTVNPPETVRVPLKVNETPAQNAQRFYKKYNKNKRAQEQLKTQIERTKSDLDYIDSLLNALEVSTELTELDEISEEFEHSHLYTKKKTKTKKKPKSEHSKLLHFLSSEGFDIYVGKNNYQNDYISTRLGKDEDCWLHVKDAAGSHVLIVADGKFIPEQTVLEGGMLAAHYSKLSGSENIPVDYVEYKYLKKPRKSVPGFVTFTHQNTMYVTPEREKIEKLKSQA